MIKIFELNDKMKQKKEKQIKRRLLLNSVIEKITTVHGTNYLTVLRGKSLTLWTAVLCGNIIMTVAFIMIIKDKFNANQIVTRINANCKVNQVPFPAVSICNFNMVSLKESRNIAAVLRHHNISDPDIYKFFDALPDLKDYNQKRKTLDNFTQIITILKHHFFTMDTIMEEVHQKCESLLLHCVFNRKVRDCGDIFSLIKTYEGYCCTFNYAALNDASEVPLLPHDEDMEYYDDQDPASASKSGTIIATSESGRMSGLSVVLNIEPDDYPPWSSVPYYGVKVLLSDPNDYPETTILYRYIAMGESVDIKVEAMVFQSEPDVRRVEPERRLCWFHDEVSLEHTNRYSYETCNTECKMRNYLETCGCIPFKYPRERSTRICDFQDLKCLNNITVNKSIKEMHCKPICYLECSDKKYAIKSDLAPFLSREFPIDVTRDRNISSLAALRVYFGKSNCNCYKLTLLIDVNYFVATYGGVFSLSFGGSVITLLEVLYLVITLIIIKIVRNVIRFWRQHRSRT